MDLTGKTAFITGAASGIGLALAQHAAALGAVLLLSDINAAQLEAAAQDLRAGGAVVHTYPLDVADLAAYRAVADAVLAEHGAPYLLCNNAGVAWKAPALGATPED